MSALSCRYISVAEIIFYASTNFSFASEHMKILLFDAFKTQLFLVIYFISLIHKFGPNFEKIIEILWESYNLVLSLLLFISFQEVPNIWRDLHRVIFVNPVHTVMLIILRNVSCVLLVLIKVKKDKRNVSFAFQVCHF